MSKPISVEPKRPVVRVMGDHSFARAIVANLIWDEKERRVVYLTAFAPQREIKLFAQVLKKKHSFDLGGKRLGTDVDLGKAGTIKTLKFEQGFGGVVVTPPPGYLVGDDQSRIYELFRRVAAQQHFVHPDWVPDLYGKLRPITPKVGTMACVVIPENLGELVQQEVAAGRFRFPRGSATALQVPVTVPMAVPTKPKKTTPKKAVALAA